MTNMTCSQLRQSLLELKSLKADFDLELDIARQSKNINEINEIRTKIEKKLKAWKDFWKEVIFVSYFPRAKNYLTDRDTSKKLKKKEIIDSKEIFIILKKLAMRFEMDVLKLKVRSEVFDRNNNIIRIRAGDWIADENGKTKILQYDTGWPGTPKTSVSLVYFQNGHYEKSQIVAVYEDKKWVEFGIL
jgi:hypothetical protein